MIRNGIILVMALVAIQSAEAQAKQSLSNHQLERIFDFYAKETGFGSKNPYFMDSDESLNDYFGNFRKYSTFYFSYGDDIVGKTASDVHFINRYTGDIVYRQSNCIRYYSYSLNNYQRKIRSQTPYSEKEYIEEHKHFLNISEPISAACFENERPKNLLSLTEAEYLFRKFMIINKLSHSHGYYAQKHFTPVTEIDSESDFDYYQFTLIPIPNRKDSPPPRKFFMNAWTGEFYEQRPNNRCTLWSSPALRAAREKLYAAKNLTETDLALHRAHFRAITDPRSANCLGDRPRKGAE